MKLHTLDKGASSEIKKDKFSFDKEGIKKWLLSKNILSVTDELLAYNDKDIWKRAGAETYTALFEIIYRDDKEMEWRKEIILKAIVSIPVEETLENWAKRRNILKKNRVPVSNWYWYGTGLIIEDYYPYSYEVVSDFNALIDTAYFLDRLGFNCSNFLRDIRCDKAGNPYYVDFGFDLGEYSLIPKKNSVIQLIKKFPAQEKYINTYLIEKYRI